MAVKSGTWEDPDYAKKRMEEKVKSLRDFLPESLVEMRVIWRVASKGVHELSEQECLKYFKSLRNGIELILDEKITKREAERKKKLALEELIDIQDEIENSPSEE